MLATKEIFTSLLLVCLFSYLSGQTSFETIGGSNTPNFLTSRENNPVYSYHENSKTGLLLGLVFTLM